VYRWAYDYNVPGAKADFLPQNEPPAPDAPVGRTHGVKH
jgi:cytochrome c oxidase subunit 1